MNAYAGRSWSYGRIGSSTNSTAVKQINPGLLYVHNTLGPGDSMFAFISLVEVRFRERGSDDYPRSTLHVLVKSTCFISPPRVSQHAILYREITIQHLLVSTRSSSESKAHINNTANALPTLNITN